tara:strand:+ start:438 stop:932 length:495 start_codon:yes stop_codon:yes gene_type:complete
MKKIIIILLIVFFQVFVLNEFLFLQYINPYYYIILILFAPIQMNPVLLLFYAFTVGLLIDIGSITFQSYGPVHALATLMLAYFKNNFIKLISIRGDNIYDFDFNNLSFYRLFLYLAASICFHHFFLFYFSYLETVFYTLKITLFSGFFTTVFLICSYYIFYKKR